LDQFADPTIPGTVPVAGVLEDPLEVIVVSHVGSGIERTVRNASTAVSSSLAITDT
jgi:hypothetical protein